MITIDLSHMKESLSLVEQHLEKLSQNISAKQHYTASFICEEILTNLARHADFKERGTAAILSMEFISTTGSLLLTFQDNSEPFNLLDFPDPEIEAALEERELGGLGIYLTKQYAKEIQYRYESPYNILKVRI